MFKKHLILSSLFIVFMALSNSALAVSIVNGNFDADLSGWSTVTNGGTAQWDAGKAVLSTGSDVAAYSSVLVQGDDGLFTFSNPIMLGAGDDLFKFDAVFATLGADALESGGGFSDNLQVWLYDANNLGDHLFTTIDALTSTTSFSFDLSSFIGHSVAFSFELNDENDGFNSQVRLDNIRLEKRPDSTTVPESGTFSLVFIGLFGLMGSLLRNKRKV